MSEDKQHAENLGSSVGYVTEFDNYPRNTGKVEVIDREDGVELELWIVLGDVREMVLSTSRDQWGVFVGTRTLTIAQEDQTRSFLDAMSQAIQYMRQQCEYGTEPATVTST